MFSVLDCHNLKGKKDREKNAYLLLLLMALVCYLKGYCTSAYDEVRLNVLGCRADLLGTNCNTLQPWRLAHSKNVLFSTVLYPWTGGRG